MKPKIILCLALVLTVRFNCLFAGEPPTTNGLSQTLIHNWEYITYPSASLPHQMYFMVGYGGKTQGLRLDIHAGGVSGTLPEIFKNHLVSSRLYLPDGTIMEHLKGKGSPDRPVGVANGGIDFVDYGLIMYFPWSTNSLAEAWFEVVVGKERYWLELPYGFDRNPADPLPPAIPGGPPKFASAMKSLTEHDHVLRWQNVHYDLGKIQNGWRLSLIQSNSVDAESEVVLYREDVKIGTSTSWETNSPMTTLSVLDASGTTVGSHCIDVHIQDGGMERSNMYVIARNGDDQRCWGQIEISVDDKSYRIVVPSSLYKYTHGHASAN